MKKVFLFTSLMFAAISSQAQWGPVVRLTNDPDSSITSFGMSWCIASSGDFVHVVWYDNRDGNWEIYYKRSTDGGITWEPDQRLTNDSAYSGSPSIAVSGNEVHVVWRDNRDGNWEIYYKRSTDGGLSWFADERLTYEYVYASEPSITVSGLILHVVWLYYLNGEMKVYYKRSTDGGLTWEPDVQLTNYVSSYNPSIAVSGTNVHVVWNDSRDGNLEIYYKRSTDGGVTWEADTRLTDAILTSSLPSIAVYGSNVHIVWADSRGGGSPEIYYKRSIDGGITWEAEIQLTDEPGYSQFPNLSLSGTVVHVVWEEYRNDYYNIYYKRSKDGGLSWEADTILTKYDNLAAHHSSVAVSGPVVHVVWYEYIDGNYEIFYTRNPSGGSTVGTDNELVANPDKNIIIYPNPASTVIQIKFINDFSQPAGNKVENYQFSVRNILGEELLSNQIQNGESIIDVTGLQNGLYFVGITTNNKKSLNAKLIIQK